MLSTITLFVLLSAVGSHGLTDEQMNDLDDFVNATMLCKNVPGLTLTLVKDGEMVVAKGYGVSDMDKGTPVTDETLFALASLSKSFTATLMAMLLSDREDNDITWTTPCKEYIPDFTVASEDEYRNEQTNLHDLFAHKLCMMDDILYLLFGGFNNITRSEYTSHRQYMPELCSYRSHFSYLNTMYTVAGEVAELLGKDTYENLIQTRIYDALGMTSSKFMHLDWEDKNFSESYIWMPDGYWYQYDKSTYVSNYVGAPAGALLSNAKDMAKYMNFLLSGGKNEFGDELVDEYNLHETMRPHSTKRNPSIQALPTYPVDESSFTYGLGWDNSMYRGYVKNNHAGSYPGFGSVIAIYRDAKAGVFVASNGPYGGAEHDAMNRIQTYAADLLLGKEPWLNTTTACTFPDPWESSKLVDSSDNKPKKTLPKELEHSASRNDFKNNKVVQSTRPLEDFVGLYGHKALGNCSVYLHNETTLRAHYGQYGYGELIQTDFDEMFFDIELEGPMAWYVEYYKNEALILVQFASSDGDVVDELVFPFVPGMPVPVFRRDVLLHDPPSEADPTPDPVCGAVRYPCNSFSTLLISLFCLFCLLQGHF
ncbi:uncharacterized protein LOC144451676 [Glandiceps talaboti]